MSTDRSPGGSRALGPDDVVPYDGPEAPPEATATRPGPAPRPQPGRPPRTGPGMVGAGTRPAGGAKPPARRRARLALTRIDPWSVFVLSLLVSLFLGVVLVVAVAVLYALVDTLGVLGSVDAFAQDLQVIDEGETVLGAGRVLGVAAVVAALDVVVLTVLATLSAFLYNVCASLTGGVEVVLAERE